MVKSFLALARCSGRLLAATVKVTDRARLKIERFCGGWFRIAAEVIAPSIVRKFGRVFREQSGSTRRKKPQSSPYGSN
jgi:hypothetical protein